MERDLGYLADILKAARKIERFAAGMSFEQFSGDDVIQSAIMYQFEIVGEAARRVSTAFVVDHPELPWSKMVSMRNRLIHAYDDVDLHVLWNAVCISIPQLIRLVEPLIPPEED